MRQLLWLSSVVVCVGITAAQEGTGPVSPDEALAKVDQRVTVRMEVKSTGGNTARYLNSDANYRSEKNFAIFIPQAALPKFQKAEIEDPAQYYKGKTIEVTGIVSLGGSKTVSNRPQIRVDDPAQIKVIDAEAEVPAPKVKGRAPKPKGGKPK
jgi:hypothetical protein